MMIYALNTKEYFYILYTKKHTSDYTNKEKQKLDLPKSFTKGETIITLEKDTDYPNSIIVSISANGEDIVNNTEAYIRASSKEGVFLIMSYKPIEPELIGFTKYTKIYINDYPDLINYLYKLGKNKELLKNYI